MPTFRRLIPLAALALAVVLVPASTASACDASSASRAVAKKPRNMRPPLIIGDSTMIFAAPMLARNGFDADARGCRQFSAGLAIVRARKRARTLPRLVVLALGANGAVGRGQLNHALRVVGRRRVLGVVTPRNSGSTSQAMRSLARRHPDRVLLIDWVRRSAGHGGWFGGDGLHVNGAGARAFTRFVRRRSEPIIAPPVGALRLPRTTTGTKRCGRISRGGRRLTVHVTRGRARVTCARARQIGRAPFLRPVRGWRGYDWTSTRQGPWRVVHARRDRRVVVALA